MITLLGTGHVFDLRRRIMDEIHRRTPDAVALELDPPRFHALRNPQEAKKKAPPAYRLLAGFQERVAEKYGVKPGDEMLAASEAARDLDLPVALIDRDARLTVRRAWKEMRFMERVRLLGALLGAAVLPAKKVDAELDRVASGDYQDLFEELGRKFPAIRRVVVDERDEHMASQLSQLSAQHPRIVAVVGDAHVDGLSRRLRERGFEVETVRLKELQTPPAPASEPASVSFRVEYDR